jgi:hypothetical protein
LGTVIVAIEPEFIINNLPFSTDVKVYDEVIVSLYDPVSIYA